MNKYKRIVDKENKILPNEIRVTADRNVHKYVKYAKKILSKDEYKYIIIQGFGVGMKNVVLVAEILKRSVGMLHSIVETGTCTLCNTYEPLEDGLDKICVYKKIYYVTIKLTKNLNSFLGEENHEIQSHHEQNFDDQQLKIKNIGYSPPIEIQPVKDIINVQPRNSRKIMNVEKRQKIMEKKKARNKSSGKNEMVEKQIEDDSNKNKENAKKERSTLEEEREKEGVGKGKGDNREEEIAKENMKSFEKKKRRKKKKKTVSSNVSTAVSPMNNNNIRSKQRLQKKTTKININENLNKLNVYNNDLREDDSVSTISNVVGDSNIIKKRYSRRRKTNKSRSRNSIPSSSLTIISSSSTTAVSSPSPSAYSSSLCSNVIPSNTSSLNVNNNDVNNYSEIDKKVATSKSMKKKRKNFLKRKMKQSTRSKKEMNGDEWMQNGEMKSKNSQMNEEEEEEVKEKEVKEKRTLERRRIEAEKNMKRRSNNRRNFNRQVIVSKGKDPVVQPNKAKQNNDFLSIHQHGNMRNIIRRNTQEKRLVEDRRGRQQKEKSRMTWEIKRVDLNSVFNIDNNTKNTINFTAEEKEIINNINTNNNNSIIVTN